MDLFCKNSGLVLGNSSIIDVQLGSKYASALITQLKDFNLVKSVIHKTHGNNYHNLERLLKCTWKFLEKIPRNSLTEKLSYKNFLRDSENV